jgi:hypothetical protein
MMTMAEHIEMMKKIKRNEKTKKITKRKTDGTRNTI